MKILVVVGSFPPEACGVGAYTARLVEAFTARGRSVQVSVGNSWPIAAPASDGTITHLQYPSVGAGTSLSPVRAFVRPTRGPKVLTLHEFTRSHILRKLASVALALAADAVVATSRREALAIRRWTCGLKRPVVIPIGSNIPEAAQRTRDIDVVYFGLLGPGKGLELFLELVELAPAGWVFAVVGEAPPQYCSFAKEMAGRASRLGVRWIGPQPDAEVARVLSSARFAYLPYPDGASERRGSLFAAMANGAVPITTVGPDTTAELGECVISAADPRAALAAACSEPATLLRVASAGSAYLKGRAWDAIAAQHDLLYTRLAGFPPRGLGHRLARQDPRGRYVRKRRRRRLPHR